MSIAFKTIKLILIVKEIKTTLLSYRRYGEPKLVKPKEIKGLKKILSLDLRPKRKSYVYCNFEQDVVYLHIRDLFSEDMSFSNPIDMSLPTSALYKKYPERFEKARKHKSFVYADAWCRIIECNEGIVKIENLLYNLNDDNFPIFLKPYLPEIELKITEQILIFPQSNSTLTDEYATDLMRFINNILSYFKTIK